MRRLILLALLVLACSPAPSPSPVIKATVEEPSLTFHSGQAAKVFTRSQLLSHPAKKVLNMVDLSGYNGRQMSYQVVPLSALVEGLELPPGSELHYQTRDGFSSSVAVSKATSGDPLKSVAYIAVEEPGKPWPKFEGRDYTAGPFYLVWENSQLSDIGREEWPFMLSSFTVQPSLESRFPKLVPKKKNSAEYRGYEVFVKECFPCHTIDGQGTGKMGPDMNVPQNPTEYMTEKALRQLIRDPHSVRTWPDLKMTGFGEDMISDKELDDLLAYLRSRRS